MSPTAAPTFGRTPFYGSRELYGRSLQLSIPHGKREVPKMSKSVSDVFGLRSSASDVFGLNTSPLDAFGLSPNVSKMSAPALLSPPAQRNTRATEGSAQPVGMSWELNLGVLKLNGPVNLSGFFQLLRR